MPRPLARAGLRRNAPESEVRTMQRRWLLIPLPCAIGILLAVTARGQDAAATDKAVAEIQQAGGKVERDDKAPEKPVTAVNFATQPIADAALESLKGMDKLQKLTLNNTKITDAGLENLRGLTGLQKLYLVDTSVTDAGLAHVKELTNLQILSLVGTQVTDAGLESLKGLANLKTVFLAGTKVTDEGVKKLQEALPMLKIER
jgi:hypothetical protein